MKNEHFAKACELMGNMTKLATAVGISPAFAWQIREGVRPCPVRVCVLIEKLTGGLVTRRELRPKDWMDIWPELIVKCKYCGKAVETDRCTHCGAVLAEKGE